MVRTLMRIVRILALFAILAAVGLGYEMSRRRHLVAFAREQGGTFEPGTLMEGAPVPEAAPFDAPLVISPAGEVVHDPPEPNKDVTYRNVVRIRGDEASYVVASRSEGHSDVKGNYKSTSHLVCIVTLPRSDLPRIDVFPPVDVPSFMSDWVFKELGDLRPVKLELVDPVPGFTKEFDVHTAVGSAKPPSGALDLVLDRTAQAELLAHRDLLFGLQVRGNAVRLHAVRTLGNDEQRELYEVARRLGKIWTSKRRR